MKIITVSREFGSGGRELGKRLSDCLGWPYYDREIISAVARRNALDEGYVEDALEQGDFRGVPLTIGRTFAYLPSMPHDSRQLLQEQRRVLRALAAHGDCIKLPDEYKEYDYEAELVAVMGKPARNVSPEEALSYVYGYTCGNDLSTRDLQFARGNQWVLSKSLDGFGPVGPCLVPAGELDPQNLDISSTVNGELRQNSNTSDMIFSLAEIIADLSRHFTLLPGDIIFTGTPSGVMQGYPADKKQWLRPGDKVAVTIEGIGTLENTFC